MTFRSDFRDYLIADATVGGMVGTRVYPNVLPQGVTYPAISYEQGAGQRERDLDGPTDRARRRLTINCWARSDIEAQALADAVRERLNPAEGMWGATAVGSVQLDNDWDEFDDSVKVYRVFQDYIISYRET